MSSPLENKRILVVDDDQDILTTIQAVFEPTGAVIDIANNGNKAVELAEKNSPDLIILDMMLPGRSGFLVLEKVKARKPRNEKPFVIMITGNQGKRHQMYAESPGFQYICLNRQCRELTPLQPSTTSLICNTAWPLK